MEAKDGILMPVEKNETRFHEGGTTAREKVHAKNASDMRPANGRPYRTGMVQIPTARSPS
eukprot:scaffold42485_cov50-Attheya_sp.AAC.2